MDYPRLEWIRLEGGGPPPRTCKTRGCKIRRVFKTSSWVLNVAWPFPIRGFKVSTFESPDIGLALTPLSTAALSAVDLDNLELPSPLRRATLNS